MKIVFGVVIILFFGLNISAQHHGQMSDKMEGVHKVVVDEVIQTSNYTYLKVIEDNKEQWVAVPKIEAVKGETYFYKGGMQMGPFDSKELNRTFENILFLGEIRSEKMMKSKKDSTTHVADVKVSLENIKVEPLADGITIAELFENKEKYNGKKVKLKGKVTKYSEKIMSRNWIHIQDGSNYHGNFDLTITSDEQVKVGEVIEIEGQVVLNKDFGYGYLYKVLVEEGKLLK